MKSITDRAICDYKNITADALIKDSPGVIHTITINSVTTGGVLTLYDSITEASPAVAAISIVTRAAGSQVPVSLLYDVKCNTGIYAGFDATLAANITISYK